MRLAGMAKGLRAQLENPEIHNLSLRKIGTLPYFCFGRGGGYVDGALIEEPFSRTLEKSVNYRYPNWTRNAAKFTFAELFPRQITKKSFIFKQLGTLRGQPLTCDMSRVKG